MLWCNVNMEKMPIYYSEDYVVDYNTVDCENPHRVIEIWLKIKEIADFIEPEPCTVADLQLCHTQRLIENVERDSQLYPVALRAAGGAIAAAEKALSGTPSFALIRPPGHHAGRAFNGGFCFFNNMTIAVKRLLADDVIRNALIVDIDLHYGNGTFDIVKDDSRIAFRNIDASSRAEFFDALEEALKDAATFDVVGCSAGFDTYIRDWGSLLFTEDYRKIGDLFVSSNPHFFSILEGGYYINDLGLNVLAYLTGIREACS
jgi:acetoin utilization deacetylase AcuC-like enzyme